MNNKMAKIYIYQQLNLKNKLSKQEQRQNHGYRERFDGCQMGCGCGGMGEEVRGLRSTNSTNTQLQNRHGNVKYSVENGVAKELIRMTMDMNNADSTPEALGGAGWQGGKGKVMTTVIA